jgi:ABC-type antimicrobial peptide transport system permease subunit
MVLRRALTPAVVGVGIGIALALVLARSMSALVFGIGAYDTVTFLAVTAGLLIVAMSASIIPAFRATRVSPLEAIRTD